MMRQYELVERVQSYNPHTDEALLNKAYVYAMQKHGHQKRGVQLGTCTNRYEKPAEERRAAGHRQRGAQGERGRDQIETLQQQMPQRSAAERVRQERRQVLEPPAMAHPVP